MLRTARPATLALVALPLLSGCALFQSQIEVSRRYEVIKNGGVACSDPSPATYCFKATLSALSASSADSSLAVSALSDRGQSAYVSALAALAKDPDALKAALAEPAKPASEPSLDTNQSKVNLRFVLGLFPTNGYLNPSDRLVWAKATITLQSPTQPADPGSAPRLPARFVSWTQAANAFDTIDVGSVTAGRTDKLTGSTGLNIAKFAPDTTAGVELSATRTETAAIRDKSAINAAIEEGRAVLIQNGGWRDDLTGNSTFDATVALDPGATRPITFAGFSKLVPPKPADGSPAPDWTPADKMKFTPRFVRVPLADPLCATVTLDFVVRRVSRGDRTFTESDDTANFERGFTTNDVTVAPPVVTEQWAIVGSRAVGGSVAAERLQFVGDSGNHILIFRSRNEALGVLAWLRGVKPAGGRIANGKLYFHDGQPLDLDAYDDLDAFAVPAPPPLACKAR